MITLEKLKRLPLYLCLSIGCVLALMPFVWMIATSLKSGGETFAVPPTFVPSIFRWDNYVQVAREIPLGRYIFNSLAVTLSITAATLVSTVMAAFAFSRLEFPGRDLIFSVTVATMVIPGEALLIPNYVTISQMGLINSYTALILPWTVSAFSVFLLRQYFLSVPSSLYNAAKVDGCSDLRFLVQIMVPVAKPALVTVGLLRVINSWNEFLWPLIVTDLPHMRTLPVALSVFTNEAGIRYHLMMATSTVIVAPVIVLYLLLQRNFIRAIGGSGIKG